MTLTTAGDSGARILRPEVVAALIVQPLALDSVAATVSTVIQTESHSTRFPVVKQDPTTAWTLESHEIDVSDASVDEINCVPSKLAGLTIISAELGDDSNPAALEVVGAGLVRDLQTRLDAAFFGNTTTNGPSGLESLADVQHADGGSTLENLDVFAGAELTNFVMNPADLLTLATAKVANDWQQPLLGIDPSSPARPSAQGVSIQRETGGPRGHHLGCPAAKVFCVLRLPAAAIYAAPSSVQIAWESENNSLGLRLPASAGRRQRSVSAAPSQPVRAVALGQVPAKAATPAPSLAGPVAASFPRRGRANHRRTNEAHRWHAQLLGHPDRIKHPHRPFPMATAAASSPRPRRRTLPNRSTGLPRRRRRGRPPRASVPRRLGHRGECAECLRALSSSEIGAGGCCGPPSCSHHASGLRRAPSRRARGDLGTVTGNPPRGGSSPKLGTTRSRIA